MMQYCRQVLGTACVLENNSLRDPAPGAAYLSMYQAMVELGAPIAFQTATADRIGSLSQTLAYAVSLGASSVELPAGYEFSRYAEQLRLRHAAPCRQSRCHLRDETGPTPRPPIGQAPGARKPPSPSWTVQFRAEACPCPMCPSARVLTKP